jgi:hypothetical protein
MATPSHELRGLVKIVAALPFGNARGSIWKNACKLVANVAVLLY